MMIRHPIRRFAEWDQATSALLAVLVLAVVIGLATLTVRVIVATNQIAHLTQQQAAFIASQNDAQLCVQHDITVAVRKIGLKLGLPVQDIVPPNVEGLDCDTESDG